MDSISFIGGDNRNYFISDMFKNERGTYTYGFLENNLSVKDCVNKSKYIVVPIPFSMDGTFLYMPLSDNKLQINDFIEMVSNKTIIGGKIDKEFAQKLEKNNNIVVDVMKDKYLIEKNAIPTAEGVIKIIIEKTDITIDGSKIAVLGFGNVGKKVASSLSSLNAEIFGFDIKEQEVANIKLRGYNVLEEINESIGEMDVIVNTVPHKILNKEKLRFINKKTLIIDVASVPGGVDFEFAKENNYKVIHALGLPGKVAPITSAKYVKDVIQNLIV